MTQAQPARWGAASSIALTLFALSSSFLTGISTCQPGDDTPTPEPTPIPEPALPRLNEVSCNDDDWIELVNLSHDLDADLEGWILSDDPTQPDHRYVLPAGSVIPPRGRLVVGAATLTSEGILFGLKCGSDTVSLLQPDEVVSDSITIPVIGTSNSYGRLPDMQGEWAENRPTRGSPNAEPGTVNEDSAWIFNPFQVITVDIGLSQAAIDQLAIDPYTYVEGTAQITSDVETSPAMKVGVHLKGKWGSYRTLDQKAAFKVKLNEYVDGQTWMGFQKFTLNNMVQDASMIHETLAYEIFRNYDVAAPRTGYAWVRVNGADYGLYTNIETVDDNMLPRHYASTQHLYEGAYGVDVYPESVYSFEVDEGNPDDRTDLTTLSTIVTTTPDSDWMASLATVADLEQFWRVWATEMYIGHWDGYAYWANNYYLHSDDAGYFHMQPWGLDQTFGSYMDYHTGYGYMFARCMAIPDCRASYDDAILGLLPILDGLGSQDTARALGDFLQPWIEADPRREYSADDVQYSIQNTIAFLDQRRAEVESYLSCSSGGACNDCQAMSYGDRQYYFCSYPRTHSSAVEACHGVGAELAIISSEDENYGILSAMYGIGYANDAWIGLSDELEEGRFVWWDGTEPQYTAWNSGEPNDYGGEDCVELYSWGPWNDLPCESSLPALCEVP